jgi:hypothetical protein
MRFFFLYLIAFPVLLFSQADTSSRKTRLELLTMQLKADSEHIYRFRKARPYFNYHERHSLANPVTTNFYGPQVGVVLYERHIAGLGAYFSGKRTREPFETTDNSITVKKNIDVNFLSAFYQYIIVNRRFFELHVPLELGSGTYYSAYRDSSNRIYKTENEPLLLAGGSVLAILKPLRWIGLSGSVGYRTTSEKTFNGYYYTLGVWIGFRPLQNDVRYHLMKKKAYKREVSRITKN